MTVDQTLIALRRAAENDYPWSVSPHEARALVAEVERLRALEADAERARVKADLWSYYEAFVPANGAGSITELVVQRDAARAEAATMRQWAAEAAEAENANADDARHERAAVVAYLREVADAPETYVDEAIALRGASASIERGAHRREDDRTPG
jgi:phosphopantetheinyl transferase